MAKVKFCDVGQHEVSVLWRARTKVQQSCCKNCLGKVSERKPIAPQSDKKLDELKVYRKNRDQYFKDHPVCEFPDCNSTRIQLHHKRGHVGQYLTDQRYFCSLCGHHHRWVEENPTQAKEMGLSEDRL